MKLVRSTVPAIAWGLLMAPAAMGQTVTLDQGTFILHRNGTEIGREEFTIRRTGSGDDAVVVAHASVEMQLPDGNRTLAPALEATGRDMAISAYQVKVSGDQEAEVYVSLSGQRFVANIRSSAGEQQLEFRATPGALLLEEGVAHQYYFLRPLLDRLPAAVPVIEPRAGEQTRMTLTSVGMETVSVGGDRIQAQRLRLEGEGDVREVWVDSDGRVLRVRIPATGLEAVRQEAPSRGES